MYFETEDIVIVVFFALRLHEERGQRIFGNYSY